MTLDIFKMYFSSFFPIEFKQHIHFLGKVDLFVITEKDGLF